MNPPPAPSAVFTPASWTAELRLEDLFPGATRPLDVELGCGKGRFLATRAAKQPERHFIGIDRLLVRIRRVDRKLQRANLTNVRLLRIESAYAVERLLPPASVSTFFVFFPDPWPKRRHHPRRLFSVPFIASLQRALVPGGVVHIRTDHTDYGIEIRKRFAANPAFAEIPAPAPEPDEVTEFEELFTGQGLPITRLSFEHRPEPPPSGTSRP